MNKPETTTTTPKEAAPIQRAPEQIGVIHIMATHNNTLIQLTDITGSETITKCTGGMVVKSQHKEGSPYAAMKVAELVAQKAKEKGFRKVHVKVRAKGGIRSKSPGQGAEAAIISLTRNGLRIVSIDNVTPIPHDGCKKKKRDRSKRK